MTTVIDDLAAKMHGAALAKVHSADALYVAHMEHPEIASLREGFLTAFCNGLLKKARERVLEGIDTAGRE